MLLQITDNLALSDIQDKFSRCFPGLKIEFCTKKHHWEELCPEHQFLTGDTLVGLARKRHDPGTLDLKSWDKVGEAEKRFYEDFGLNVQIFYKSGSRWIQTGKSDNLTLGELQERAYNRLQFVLL